MPSGMPKGYWCDGVTKAARACGQPAAACATSIPWRSTGTLSARKPNSSTSALSPA
jgi:hypothetical protein